MELDNKAWSLQSLVSWQCRHYPIRDAAESELRLNLWPLEAKSCSKPEKIKIKWWTGGTMEFGTALVSPLRTTSSQFHVSSSELVSGCQGVELSWRCCEVNSVDIFLSVYFKDICWPRSLIWQYRFKRGRRRRGKESNLWHLCVWDLRLAKC